MSISIIQPGMFTVQDEGRFGFQHLGFQVLELWIYIVI